MTRPPDANNPLRVLILGGTTEARELTERLAALAGIEASVSLAGRTRNPLVLPAPTRSGGFGGVEGLVAHLRAEKIDALVDATHPFAAIMSRHAADAAKLAGVPLLALVRPEWERLPGDIWTEVADVPQAVAALGKTPRNVLVTLGRNEVRALETVPQHRYLIRSIDPVEPKLALPSARYIETRGPFIEAEEQCLLVANDIHVILAKNSGGTASYAKIIAARALGLTVIMITRPARPAVEAVAHVDEALAWLERL